MKRIASIFLSLTVLISTRAQTFTEKHLPVSLLSPIVAPEITEKFQFAKNIELGEWAGHNFRYEMAVRSANGDSISGLQFFGAAADKKNNLLDDKFVTVETRHEQEWTVYTIVGKLPKQTSSAWFFTSVTASGTYYFDDISLFLESSPGLWKQVPVHNGSFEEAAAGSFAGYAVIQQESGNPYTALSDKVYKTGKHSLMITYEEERRFKNVMAGE